MIEITVLKIEFSNIFKSNMFKIQLLIKTEFSILLGSFPNHNLSD